MVENAVKVENVLDVGFEGFAVVGIFRRYFLERSHFPTGGIFIKFNRVPNILLVLAQYLNLRLYL
jgi:hypothetical protein